MITAQGYAEGPVRDVPPWEREYRKSVPKKQPQKQHGTFAFNYNMSVWSGSCLGCAAIRVGYLRK